MLPIRFLPHSAYIKTKAGVDAWVNQVESTTPEPGISLFEESAGSETDREFVATKSASPTIPIATSDLALLTTIGFSGVPIVPDTGKPGLTIFARELPLGAVPTAIATANHIKLVVSDGLLVPVSIQASHNAAAKLSLMVHAILGTDATYSGATPIVVTASTAITSGAGQTANIYTTGPVKYTVSGGSSRLVQGITNLGVNFGIQVLTEGDSGNVYPGHTSIISRMTKFEFSTKDVELISEIGDGVSVSAFGMYFRKVTANGQRVAEATTSHIAISGTAGMITPGATHLAHKQAGSTSYTFTPAKNTNLIAISVASAIPTS